MVELSQRVAEIQLTGQGHVGYLEMALLNYVAYRDFATQLVHGRQVTSRFLYQEKKRVLPGSNTSRRKDHVNI